MAMKTMAMLAPRLAAWLIVVMDFSTGWLKLAMTATMIPKMRAHQYVRRPVVAMAFIGKISTLGRRGLKLAMMAMSSKMMLASARAASRHAAMVSGALIFRSTSRGLKPVMMATRSMATAAQFCARSLAVAMAFGVRIGLQVKTAKSAMMAMMWRQCLLEQCARRGGDGVRRADLGPGDIGYEECDDGDDDLFMAVFALSSRSLWRWLPSRSRAARDGYEARTMGTMMAVLSPACRSPLCDGVGRRDYHLPRGYDIDTNPVDGERDQ